MSTAGLTYTHKKQLDEQTIGVRIQVLVESPKASVPKAGILYFRISDDSGNQLEAEEKYVISKKYGTYSYVDFVKGQSVYTFDIGVNAEARFFEVGLAEGAVKFGANPKVSVIGRTENSETDLTLVSESNPMDIDGVRTSFPVAGNVAYRISWKIKAADTDRGLMLVSFEDGEGNAILPVDHFAIHPTFGSYKYLGTNDPGEVVFTAPEGASKVLLTGMHWKGRSVKLVGKPEIANENEDETAVSRLLSDWIEEIGQSDNLLLLHSTAGSISSNNKLLLRSNRTALEMSNRGWKVIYIPFGSINDADRLVNKNLMQVAGSELVSIVDRLVSMKMTGKRVFICSSHSDMVAVSLQNRLQDYGWKTVYEIRDDMEEFRRVGYSKWYSPALELRFSTEADALLATSPRLLAKLATMSGRENITYLPNAAPDELISQTVAMRSVEHQLKNRQTDTVGYLGHLTDSWFDWQKFIDVVKMNPLVNFELIGHGVPKDIRLPMNVKYFGPMGHDECLPIVSKWTVGLIPFKESRLTYGVDPNKVYEYVAMGLQTVSSPMGDLLNVPGVHLYRTTQEFHKALNAAMSFHPTESFYDECDTFLETASWTYRVGQISDFIEGLYK